MRFNFLLPLRRFTCIVCLFIPVSIFAQDYRSGYVIKNNRDSVSGFIEYSTEKKNSSYCKFRTSRKSKATKFSPEELLAYGYYGDKRYESMTIPDGETKKRVFVKVLVSGPMNLYQYQNIFLVKRDSLILLPTPKSQMVETSQGSRSKDDSRYKGLLNILLSDCKLSANETRYTEYELTNLFNNYNRCKGVEVAQRKPKPIFNVNYVVFGGYLQSNLELTYKEPVAFNKSNTVVGGFGVDLSSPRIFDRAFFSVDLSYVQNFYQAYQQVQSGYEIIHYDYMMNFTSIKMPFGLRYSFLKDTNTPYIKAGLVLSFMTDSDVRVNEERQTTNGQVTTKESNGGIDLQKRPKGVWISVGYNRRFYKNLHVFGEIRYEKSEGFIGTAIQSFSDMKNLSFMLGIRF